MILDGPSTEHGSWTAHRRARQRIIPKGHHTDTIIWKAVCVTIPVHCTRSNVNERVRNLLNAIELS